MRKNGVFEARFQTENIDLFDVGETLNCDNLIHVHGFGHILVKNYDLIHAFYFIRIRKFCPRLDILKIFRKPSLVYS